MTHAPAPSPRLIAFVDPMCSWCYGFAPVLEAIAKHYGASLPIHLVMGGLRPGTTEPMTDKMKTMIREHWEHVHTASGQPFDMAFFDRTSFTYDTDPAARAVVLMRGEFDTSPRGPTRCAAPGCEPEPASGPATGPGFPNPAMALPFFARIQRAFYAENRDVTDDRVLAELAAEFGADKKAFAAALRHEDTRTEVLTDYTIAQRTGATGFPTMIAGFGENTPWVLVTKGYQPAERILAMLAAWLAESAAAQPENGLAG